MGLGPSWLLGSTVKVYDCILRHLPSHGALVEAEAHLLLHLALVEVSAPACHPGHDPLHTRNPSMSLWDYQLAG